LFIYLRVVFNGTVSSLDRVLSVDGVINEY
jgi:hypothetical protein